MEEDMNILILGIDVQLLEMQDAMKKELTNAQIDIMVMDDLNTPHEMKGFFYDEPEIWRGWRKYNYVVFLGKPYANTANIIMEFLYQKILSKDNIFLDRHNGMFLGFHNVQKAEEIFGIANEIKGHETAKERRRQRYFEMGQIPRGLDPKLSVTPELLMKIDLELVMREDARETVGRMERKNRKIGRAKHIAKIKGVKI